MAFPDEPLPLIIEANYGGTWRDLSDRLMTDTVTITRGKAAGARQVSTGSCRLVLDDADGALTPLNPSGEFYPHVRRGAEFRIRLPEAPGAGGSGTTASVVAPSVEVLDGPALLACMWLATEFSAAQDFNFTLPGGMTGGAEVDDGNFSSSVVATATVAAGTTGTRTATASPTPDNWQALTVSVPGTVTVEEQLGDAALGADVVLTTASGTQAGWWLLALQGWDFTAGQPPAPSGDGWMMLAEVDELNSGCSRAWLKKIDVGGAQAVTFDSTAGVDNHAHLLVLSGVLSLVLPTAAARRLAGTAAGYRPRLVPTTDGTLHAVQQIDVAGPLRRFDKGQSVVMSAFKRQALDQSNAAVLKGYWPCEDGSDARQIAAGLPDLQSMRILDDRNFAADSTSFPGSAPLLKLAANTGLGPGRIPLHAGTGTIAFRGLFAFPSGGLADGTVLVDLWQETGTVRRWRLRYLTVSSGSLEISAIGSGGTVLDSGAAAFGLNGLAMLLGFTVEQNGSDVDWSMFARHVVDDQVVQGGLDGTFTGLIVDRAALLYVAPGRGCGDVTVGHFLVGTDASLAANIDEGMTGHRSETAADRIERLCAENGVPVVVTGTSANSAAMGAQGIDTLPNLLRESAFADGGPLGEDRHTTAVAFRTRESMYNQTPALAVNLATYRTGAGTSAGVLAPVYDDTGLINRYTAERRGGSSVVAEDTDSIDEDGLSEDGDEFNVDIDDQVADIAGWEVHLGTVDEYRNPALALDLAANPELIPQWAAVELGDRVQRLNPPAPHPPGTIDQLLDGYTETLGPKRWEVAANTQPGGPWAVAEVLDPNAGHGYDPRVAADGDMVLVQAVDADDTALLVESVSGEQRWATPTDDAESADDFPMAAVVGGEVVTVSDVDPGATDAFGRTVASGWGAPDTSGMAASWSTSHSSDSSVSGGTGRISQGTVGVLRTAMLDLGAVNAEVTVDTGWPIGSATGNTATKWVCLRAADLSNYYVAQLILTTAGQVQLTIVKRVAGSLTSLDAGGSLVTAGANNASDLWRVTFRAAGAGLVATCRNVTTGAASARVAGNDSSLTVGTNLVFGERLEAGFSGGTPVVGTWDDLTVASPQILTVARATNGIVKSHAAGAVLEVAEPAYVAR